MRAVEFLDKKRLTLRHIHKLKKDKAYRQRELERQMKIVPIMYGDRNRQRENLELERLRLELQQMKAEIKATEAETEKEKTARILDIVDSKRKRKL